MLQTIEDRLKSDFYNNPSIKQELKIQLGRIDDSETTPFAAAELLLNLKSK
jgi:LAO/AO transport system kinase